MKNQKFSRDINLLVLFIVIFSGFAFTPALAQEVAIQITTDGAALDYEVAVSGNRIVWSKQRSNSQDIYTCVLDPQTGYCPEQQISYGSSFKQRPSVSGNRIAWKASDAAGFSDIYMFDFNTGNTSPFSNTPAQHVERPAISGSFVVYERWADGSEPDLYLYDITKKQTVPIAIAPGHQSAAAIDGKRIVWADTRNSDQYSDQFEIYSCTYDPVTGSCPNIRITNDTIFQLSPAISGNLVVWEDYRTGRAKTYLYNLTTRTGRPLTTTPYPESHPRILGNRVVYESTRNDGYEHLFLYDLTTGTEEEIQADMITGKDPAISGNLIAWEDYRNGGQSDIYAIYKPPSIGGGGIRKTTAE